MSLRELTLRFGNPKSQYDPATKIWTGRKEAMDTDLDRSIGELMLESLLKNPELISQICTNDGREYSNKEIAEYAISVACHFRKLGFEQCEVVGFVGLASEYVFPLIMGALLNGLAISALHPSMEKDGIKHMYSTTKPSIVFCDRSAYERIKESLKEMGSEAKIYTMDEPMPGVPHISEFLNGPTCKDSFECVPLKNGGKQIAFISCSSGTTGLSKGVCLTHESLRSRNLIHHYRRGDRIVCYTTLYWISGIFILVVGTLNGSTYLYSKNRFTTDELFQVVEKYKPTVIFSPPTVLALCLAAPKFKQTDFSSIKCFMVGGAPVQPSVIERVKPHLPNADILIGYGMTENPGCFICSVSAPSVLTVGNILTNLQMKVVDENKQSLGPNETGEFYIRSNLPFAGYYGNPAASADFVDEDGWMISGDVGYVNDDGNVFIVDRKKDICKHYTFHYSPTEIESKITEIPEVAEVCVCGIPDDIANSLPAAMVVLREGSSLNEDYVFKYVADRLDDFKKLRGGVYFVRDIPKTATGKPLRREVVQLCAKLRNNSKNV